MHIAKTSGLALAAGLLEAIDPRHPVTGFDRVMFGGFDDFDSMDDAARRTICDNPMDLPPDADFVHGHFSCSTTLSRYPTAQFVTVLREPRVRLLSLWRYWRIQTTASMAGWGTWADVVGRSHAPLASFVADPVVACQTDNMTLRMLLWPHPLIPDDDFIDPRHDDVLMEAARRRLERFDHVDVVENSALATRLQEWLGRPFAYRLVNETPSAEGASRQRVADVLTSPAVTLIESRSRLDMRLWESVAADRMPDRDPTEVANQALSKASSGYA